jgi:hypothetical protein
MVVPFLIASRLKIFKGEMEIPKEVIDMEENKYGNKMLFIGLGSILFVPIFKTVTGLPTLCWNDAVFSFCSNFS